MQALNCKMDNNLNYQVSSIGNNSVQSVYRAWDFWERDYYPNVIRESYPVYIQERAIDKGKQAFEIIKTLKDKKFLKLDTVGDFIDCMDTLIKTL